MRARAVAAAAVLAPLAYASAAFGGEIGGRPVDAGARYIVTACEEPDEPDFRGMDDVDAYNDAVAAYRSYVDRVKAYVACVETEAQADLDTIGQVIYFGAAQQVADAQKMIDDGLAQIEEERESLEAAGQ